VPERDGTTSGIESTYSKKNRKNKIPTYKIKTKKN
jgi:hypothetical protein